MNDKECQKPLSIMGKQQNRVTGDREAEAWWMSAVLNRVARQGLTEMR